MSVMHKRWLIIWLLLAGVAQGVNAQVSLTLQVPPVGALVKNQLWNMLLVNAADRTILVRVSLVLLDVKNNQPVLTALTGPVSLNKGGKQLQANDFNPIQYTYTSQASFANMDQNGLLPAGSYQACYTVVDAGKAGAPMVENCVLVNVDPLSPPLLNTPEDGGGLLTPWPQFTWLPPAPLGIFYDLNYDLLMVEVFPGQSTGDAIQQNVPVFNATRLKNLFVNFPASYPALDTAKLYAWRVVALNGMQAAALSDVWTFRVTNNRSSLVRNYDHTYLELRRGEDALIASAGNMLKISWENAAADQTIKYRITNLEDAGNPTVQEGELPVRFGNNLLSVPIQRKKFQRNKVYLFRFTDSRSQTWSMKFTWQPASFDIIPNRP